MRAEIEALRARFENERRAFSAALVGVELDVLADPATGWTVRQLIAHITMYEEALLLAAQAALRGERHLLPERAEAPDRDSFNAARAAEHQYLPDEYVWAEWGLWRFRWDRWLSTQEDSILDAAALPPFPSEQPWTVRSLALRALDHEASHLNAALGHLKPGA